MNPAKVTSKTLTPPPGNATPELLEAWMAATRALVDAEYAATTAARDRTSADQAVLRYENMLLEAMGQGTLL